MSKDKKAHAAVAGASSGKSSAAKSATNKGAAAKSAVVKTQDKWAVRRRYPRYTLDVRLQVKMFQEGEFRTCWGRSTEIGQDGIGATLTGTLTTGEIVTLEIPLPLTPYPIKVRAIVRFCQGLRYGFEFLTMNESQRDTVQRVCEYLATRQ
jgi:hypothetical protein